MDRLFGVLLIVFSAASFGAMPLLARLAYNAGADPTTLLFLRFIIASVLMTALMFVRRIRFPRGRDLGVLILMGAVVYVSQSLSYFTALSMAAPGLVAILLYLYPAFVTVLMAVFLKSPITKTKILALTLCLTGTYFTIGLEGGGQIAGIILAITAAFIYALYTITGSEVARKSGAFPSSAVIMISAGLVFGGLVALRGGRFPTNPIGWLSVLALALVSTVFAIAAYLAGLKRIDPANAAMISTLEPVVAVVLSVIFLGEAVTPSKVMGGSLILAAVILLARAESKPTEAHVG